MDIFNKDKKGISLSELPQVAFVLMMFIIAIGLAAYVGGTFQGQMTANSTAWTVINTSMGGLTSLANMTPLIGIVIAIVVILGVLAYIKFGGQR